MRRVRAVIFDFDGVLLESNDLKTQAFATVFGRFPQHQAEMLEFHQANVSASRYDKFRHLVTTKLGLPGDDPMVEELAKTFSGVMRRQLKECPWVPGAQSLLARLRGRVPIFVVSMTPQEELEDVAAARDLADVFDRMYGCPPWTKTRAIGDILDRVGVPAPEVVFIGDSAGDQRAAQETQVEFIARDSGLALDEPVPRRFADLNAVQAALEERLP